jgi:hypothetical protein
MAPRFSRPRLIDDQDRQYRAFLAQIMLTRQNQRATRPPGARELFGGEAEAALRAWLAQRVTLSNRRIVEYNEHRGRQAIRKYRELDAVEIPDAKTINVFEAKASQKATSLRRAAQQLRDTREILGMLFARVHTTIMLVDTGIPATHEAAREQLAEYLARRERPPLQTIDPPPLLEEVLAQMPHLRLIESLDQRDPDPAIISVLRFSVGDIVALAGAENLHLDWDEDEDEDEPAPELERYSFGADAEDDDESPMAAALRKAMQSGDEG